MDEYELIARLNNKQLMHKLKACRSKAKQYIEELKALVKINDMIKFELKSRVALLEDDLKLAESYREKSDQPIFDHLLDLH